MPAWTLNLAPEFGGVPFGPFQDSTIYLGSDNTRCQIVLHPSLGVRPVHASVSFHGGGAMVSPVEMSGAVFAAPRGQVQGASLRGSTNLAVGDGFALVSATGPRFTLAPASQVAAPPPPLGGLLPPSAARRLTPGAFQAEVGRVADRELHRMGPFATVSKLGYQLRSGALTQPRVVVGLVVGGGAFLFASCGGLASAVWLWMNR